MLSVGTLALVATTAAVTTPGTPIEKRVNWFVSGSINQENTTFLLRDNKDIWYCTLFNTGLA
jgi:hypothetical protein